MPRVTMEVTVYDTTEFSILGAALEEIERWRSANWADTKEAELAAQRQQDGVNNTDSRAERYESAPAQAVPEPAQPVPVAEQTTPAPVPSERDVVAAVRDMHSRCGLGPVVQLLSEFEAKRASDLKPELRAEFIRRAAEAGK